MKEEPIKQIASSEEPNYHFYYFINVVILVIGILSSLYIFIQVDTGVRSDLIERAESIAKLIPAQDVRNLSGSEADLTKPEYQRIKKSLTDITVVNRNIRFMYLMGLSSDGKIFFYVDSEDPQSEDYSPPGQVYDEASLAMYKIFEDKKSGLEVAEDRWGKWISGYAAVLDDDGNVVATLGVDTPAGEHLFNTIIYSLLPLIASGLILILIHFMHYARRRDFEYLQQRRGFLSMASHEIRTPLTGIRWASETLLSQLAQSNTNAESQRKLIFQIHESCVNLIARINNILSATSLETMSDARFRPEPVNIKAFFEEMINSLILSAKERGVAFVIDQTISDQLQVTFDKQNMRHVFLNILSNALKYTRAASEVNISYDYFKNFHIFRVSDQGTGISKADQDKIWSGYYRTEKAAHSEQHGNGLGLYLARTIINLHKGSIEIEKSDENGTTFIIKIPDTH